MELLVVISIIALLLSILLPSLNKAKELAKRAVCASGLKQIGTGVMVYAQSNNDKIPMTEPRVEDYPWRSYKVYEMDTNGDISKSFGFAYLFDSKIIEIAEVFYCPAIRKQLAAGNHYETYTDGGNELWPWADASLGYIVRAGYTYYPQHAKLRETVRSTIGDKKVPKIAKKTSELSGSYAISTDLLFQWDAIPHSQAGNKKCMNAVFGDGHVYLNGAGSDALDWDLWHPDPGTPFDYPGQHPANFKAIMSLLRP